ncbi:MAG: D-alanine--D-alanine ligase [Nitrospirae bacterium]|nr:D-alanine--D-alanine ligase [Nitrospirota bacterium]
MIAVLMGGVSSEREVSLKSGTAIFDCLKDAGYAVVSVDAGRNVAEILMKVNPDVAIIALHGGWGENGSIQGLLELLSIPYTGSGVLASALAMNKYMSKVVFIERGINVPPFVLLDKEAFNEEPDMISGLTGSAGAQQGTHFAHRPESWEEPWPKPWIVKPCGEGSSIGIHIVRNDLQYREATADAFSYGGKVLVERFIPGKEIHVGILRNKVLGSVEVRPTGEFYDYRSKYTTGCTRYVLPPEVDEVSLKSVEETALMAHKAIGSEGVTRVDTILSEQGEVYVLEVNTLPGMTNTSLIPKIAARAGYSFLTLVEEMLSDALAQTGCVQTQSLINR